MTKGAISGCAINRQNGGCEDPGGEMIITTKFRNVPASKISRCVRKGLSHDSFKAAWKSFRGKEVEIINKPIERVWGGEGEFCCAGPLYEVNEEWLRANGFGTDLKSYVCAHMIEKADALLS